MVADLGTNARMLQVCVVLEMVLNMGFFWGWVGRVGVHLRVAATTSVIWLGLLVTQCLQALSSHTLIRRPSTITATKVILHFMRRWFLRTFGWQCFRHSGPLPVHHLLLLELCYDFSTTSQIITISCVTTAYDIGARVGAVIENNTLRFLGCSSDVSGGFELHLLHLTLLLVTIE